MNFNKERLLENGSFVLKEAGRQGTSQAEVVINLKNEALTRLANSRIDQNIAEKRAKLRITVYHGKRKGSVNVEVFDNESIKKAVMDASKIAKISGPNEDFESLPEPQEYSSKLKSEDLLSKATIDATPEQRAEQAMLAIDSAHDIDKRIKAVAGRISNTLIEKIVMNSLGIEAYGVLTHSGIDLTILANEGEEETAGWAADYRRDFSQLRVKEVAEKAAHKASHGFGMKLVKPGDYEVVLEPEAFAGILGFVMYYGFNALMCQDHLGFLRGKTGKKLFSEKLSLWSDPLDDKQVLASTFDDEGVATRRTDLIKQGVIESLTYNTLTANKDGVESTGHNYYVELFSKSVPWSTHNFVAESDSCLEEMISETKKGILVTHFHYQNAVNPSEGVFTGLTRDGAWLIQNGEIIHPLRTLRYTDSAPRFLAEIDLVGKYQELSDNKQAIVPPIKLPSFVFTGSAEK